MLLLGGRSGPSGGREDVGRSLPPRCGSVPGWVRIYSKANGKHFTQFILVLIINLVKCLFLFLHSFVRFHQSFVDAKGYDIPT